MYLIIMTLTTLLSIMIVLMMTIILFKIIVLRISIHLNMINFHRMHIMVNLFLTLRIILFKIALSVTIRRPKILVRTSIRRRGFRSMLRLFLSEGSWGLAALFGASSSDRQGHAIPQQQLDPTPMITEPIASPPSRTLLAQSDLRDAIREAYARIAEDARVAATPPAPPSARRWTPNIPPIAIPVPKAKPLARPATSNKESRGGSEFGTPKSDLIDLGRLRLRGPILECDMVQMSSASQLRQASRS